MQRARRGGVGSPNGNRWRNANARPNAPAPRISPRRRRPEGRTSGGATHNSPLFGDNYRIGPSAKCAEAKRREGAEGTAKPPARARAGWGVPIIRWGKARHEPTPLMGVPEAAVGERRSTTQRRQWERGRDIVGKGKAHFNANAAAPRPRATDIQPPSWDEHRTRSWARIEEG